MFKPLEYTEESLKAEYEFITEAIEHNAYKFELMIKEIQEVVDIVEAENYLYKQAFLYSVDFIQDYIMDLLHYNAIKACVQTKEFNYKPFIDTLLEAITYHIDEIVKIIPKEAEQDVEIELDFSPLGDIEEYAEAVQSVRDYFLGGVKTSPQVASHMWKEKYYGTAREGKKIVKKLKGKGKDEESREVDITEKYIQAYQETILERMKLLGTSAPFWYLIEHGNIDIKFLSDSGGIPYPVFAGTHFIENTEFAIWKIFDDLLRKNRKRAEDFVVEYISSIYNLPKLSGGLKNYLENLDSIMRKKILEEIGKQSADIELKKSWELITKIKSVNKTYEFYKTRGGKLGARARGAGGRFVKLSD